jgi:hypothetical protein
MHTFVALHTWPAGQSPQGKLPPQPSPTVPQNWLPALAQVSGMQPALTHTLLVQVSPAAHVPQSKPCPQPSPIVPQNLVPLALHVPAWQLAPPTHKFELQVQSALQFMPQSIVPLQPSPMAPQYWPPSGIHDTDVLQFAPSSPPSGTLMPGPPPVLVCPLLPALAVPAAPLAPPVFLGTVLAAGPLEQLAIAATTARYNAPEKNHLAIAANACGHAIDQITKHNCPTFHATNRVLSVSLSVPDIPTIVGRWSSKNPSFSSRRKPE